MSDTSQMKWKFTKIHFNWNFPLILELEDFFTKKGQGQQKQFGQQFDQKC
jgi:hypothetical protein